MATSDTGQSSPAWDGEAEDYARDANGRLMRVHYVDAKVYFLLRTPKGSIRSLPEVGETISHIEHINPERIQEQVRSRVVLALDEPLRKGEIQLLNIELDTSVAGRLMVGVSYRNLITLTERRVTSRPVSITTT